MGDPDVSEMPLDSFAWALSSTVKSCINSRDKTFPYFNTRYCCAEKNPEQNIIKIVLHVFFKIYVVNTILMFTSHLDVTISNTFKG